MFDGIPADQFHQLMASSRPSLPIPPSFALHHRAHGVAVPSPAPPTPAAAAFPGCFDLYPSHQMLQVVQPHPHIHPQLHHHSPPPADGCKTGGESAAAAVVTVPEDPWSNDEVLTLLRIRSSTENWFPDAWEHVSRKLGEHGYQRSADKCKEKFEEESRHFNTNMGYNKNLRFFSDLDELYQHDMSTNDKGQDLGKEGAQQPDEQEMNNNNVGGTENTAATTTTTTNPCSYQQVMMLKEQSTSKKRKRKHKFEMLEGFFEAVVKRIVAQQEDLHNKLIEDMVRRDEESIAREQAWKSQEMDRINKESLMRAREQVIAWERQAKIIDLLKKFTTSSGAGNSEEDQDLITKIDEFLKVRKTTASATCVTSSSEILPPASSMSNLSHHQNPTESSTTEATPSPKNQYHSSLHACGQSPSKKSQENPFSPPPSSALKKVERRDQEEENKGGGGKRWPRDEVQALINLKCQTRNSSNGDESSKESAGSKGPLWERISQGMMELGYNRSAKRCKEKWENINKYFRKTKDSNKKRSLESRTCPYFHQLSTLYTKGTLALPLADVPADQPPDQSK